MAARPVRPLKVSLCSMLIVAGVCFPVSCALVAGLDDLEVVPATNNPLPEASGEAGSAGSAGADSDGDSGADSDIGVGDSDGDSPVDSDTGDTILDTDSEGGDSGTQDSNNDADGLDGEGGCPVDPCPAEAGVLWQCKKRFVFGANYGWRAFGADFGGNALWQKGNFGWSVSQKSDEFGTDLAKMQAEGVNVVRWFMFGRFYSDGILNDDASVTGVTPLLVDDIEKALELAELNDVYLILTFFSFPNFWSGGWDTQYNFSMGMQPLIVDAVKRKALLNNLVQTVAEAAFNSPYRSRLFAWDLFNEPESVMTGPNKYDPPDSGVEFGPCIAPPADSGATCQTVTHDVMESFLNDMAAVLRKVDPSVLLTVGSAGSRWATAWTHLDIDFYQLHYWDWQHANYPYQTHTPASLGLTDKPVIIGEFPLNGIPATANSPAISGADLLVGFREVGFAGALGWAYNDPSVVSWDDTKNVLKSYSAQHLCDTQY